MLDVVGHGACNPTQHIIVCWCFARGLQMTQASLVAGLSETIVKRLYGLARVPVVLDALRRQSMMRFGGDLSSSRTVDVEADEKRFKAWTSSSADSADSIAWHWCSWLGITERGNAPGLWGQSKLWLRCIGVTASSRQARVPPLSAEVWERVINELFDGRRNINLFTDGATVYGPVNHPAIITHHTAIGCPRPGLAGTQRIESAWKRVKRWVPQALPGAGTPQARARLAAHIREGQWRVLLGNEDTWPAWCHAVRRFAELRLDADSVLALAEGTLPLPVEGEGSVAEPELEGQQLAVIGECSNDHT